MTIEAVVKNLSDNTDMSVVVVNNETKVSVTLPATETEKGHVATLTAIIWKSLDRQMQEALY